jgi:hypothetical protein
MAQHSGARAPQLKQRGLLGCQGWFSRASSTVPEPVSANVVHLASPTPTLVVSDTALGVETSDSTPPAGQACAISRPPRARPLVATPQPSALAASATCTVPEGPALVISGLVAACTGAAHQEVEGLREQLISNMPSGHSRAESSRNPGRRRSWQ